jgi:DNA adenine methylase
MGGKERVASDIAEVLLHYGRSCDRYVEPFMGGASILSRMAPHYDDVLTADIQPDLVLMWSAIARGWEPPDIVSRDEYQALKTASPSALRGFVGFGCSFGGKWFGGYASDGKGRDYCGGSKRTAIKKAKAFKHAQIHNQSYETLIVADGDLVYCDPPYADTTSYAGAPVFNHDAFWSSAEYWAGLGAYVFVSEYTAPPRHEAVWSARKTVDLARTGANQNRVENLFLVRGR